MQNNMLLESVNLSPEHKYAHIDDRWLNFLKPQI